MLSVVSVVARNVQRFTHSTRFSPSYTNGYSFVGFSEVKKEPAATKSESAQPFELETPYEVQQRQTTPLAKANVSGRASSIEALKPSCALAKWFTTLYTFCLLPTHHALLSDTFIFDTLYQLPPKKNVPQNATKPQPMTNTTNVLKPSPSYVWDSWEKNISPGVLANLLLSVLNLAPHLALFRDSDDATSHCLNALSANPALAETLVPLPPLPLHELLLPDLPEPKSPTAETSDLSYAPEKIARKTGKYHLEEYLEALHCIVDVSFWLLKRIFLFVLHYVVCVLSVTFSNNLLCSQPSSFQLRGISLFVTHT